MTVEKRGRGRPKSPDREQMWMRVSTAERTAWQRVADRLGIDLTTWVRMTCNDRSKK